MRPVSKRSVALLACLGVLVSCRDLTLPAVPGAPKPGSISGRVVVAQPGRPGVVPVSGAEIEVLGTGLKTRSDSAGFFLIEGIANEAGQLLLRADLDGDGRPERQRLLSLQALKAGLGKQIALGDVVLSENAIIRGQVLRDDVSTPSGHGGTIVFVPVGPYTTTTADDGSFSLNELPEGTLSLAFFRVGYAPRGFDNVTLSSGQELTLRTVRLLVETTMPPPAELKGKVVTAEGAAASGASIVIESTTAARREATAGADGSFAFANVEVGIYSVTASRVGSTNARLLNLLITGGTTSLPDLVLGPGGMTGTGGGSGGGTGGGSGGGTGGGSGGGTGGGSGGGTGGGSGGGTGGGGGSTGTDGGGSGGDGGSGRTDGGPGGTDGGSGGTDAGNNGPPPGAPTNVMATASNGQVTLSWAPSSGATSHRLYWAAAATVTPATGTAILNVTSPFIHQGLTNGTQYAYVVTAVNAGGESVASSVVIGTPSASTSTQPPFIAVTRPDTDQTGVFLNAPILIRASKPINGATATSSTVILTGDAGVLSGSITAANDTIVLTPSAPFVPGASYQVTVTTGLQDNAGQPLPAQKTWRFTAGSPAPANLQAEFGTSAVTLHWSPVAGASQYSVNRSTTATGAITTYTTTGVTFTDELAQNGTTYFYTVTAMTPLGVTAPSNQVSATPSPSRPSAPFTLKVRGGQTTALLNWSPIAAATGYTVFRATSPGGPFTSIASAYASTTFLDTGRPTDSSVFYVVQAESLAGRSAYSAEAGAVLSPTLAPAPANLTATPGYAWARLQWSAVPGATGYLVYEVAASNQAPTYEAYVTSGTKVDLTSLTNGTTYRYFVTAVTNGVLGDRAEVSVTPLPTLAPQPVVQGLPTARVNRIDLTWGSVPGQTVATVYRSTTSGPPYTALGTSTVDSTAVGGTKYFYVVRADNGTSPGEYSNEVSATALTAGAPVAPTGVTAEGSTGSVQVRWNAVPDTYGYEVRTSTTPGGPYTGTGCTTTEPFETQCSFTWTNETPVYLAVRSTNGTTSGGFGVEQTATPTATTGLPRPSMFIVGGNGALSVSWYLVVNATTYRVFRRTPTSDWVLLGTTPSLTWNDTTVSNGTPYKYGVQATTDTGTRLSVWDTLNYTTPTVRRPVRPQNPTLTPYNSGVMVSWPSVPGAVSDGAASYTVLAGYAPGSAPSSTPTYCTTSEPYETRCFLSTTNGTAYYVSLQVDSPEGPSARTDEQQVTSSAVGPAAPNSLVTRGNGEVTVTATEVTDATSYRLYRRTRGTDWALLQTRTAPFFTDAITNHVEHRYAMQAVAATGVSRWTFENWAQAAVDRPSTAQPVGIVGGNGEVTVSWAPVLGATYYYVYTAPTPEGPFTYRSYTDEPFDTRLNFASANGTAVSVLVVAYSSTNATSAYSSVVTVTPSAGAPLSAQPTLQPGNNAAYLTWPAVAGATAYRVFRRFAETDWQPLSTISSARLTDFNVQNGETVRYAVQSVNGGAESGWNFTQPRQVSDTLPLTPNDVVVTPGNAAVQVSWARVPGATSYRVSTSVSSTGPYAAQVIATGEYETRARLTNLTNGTPVWVIVEAVIGSTEGVPSPETSARPAAALPATQSSVTATAGTPGVVQLTWFASSGATSYRLYRRLPTSTLALLSEGASLLYNDTGLTPGTVYTYYVEPVNLDGSGAWSLPASITAP